MNLLTRLTPEQQARIPEIRRKWLEIGLSTNPLQIDRVREAIVLTYRCAGLNPPRLTLVLDVSPYTLLAINEALRIVSQTQVKDQVKDQVSDQVKDQVSDQVRDQVWAQVWDQVGDQVEAQVWDQVWDQVRGQVRDQVWDQVEAQVWDQVKGQVRDQVEAQVRGQVKGQVVAQVKGQVGAQVWDQVAAQVWNQVWGQVWDRVEAQVSDQVWDQVRAQVWDQVKGQVGDQVWDRVEAQVKGQVAAQVRDQVVAQVKGQVGGQVRDQVWDQVGDQVWDQVGAQVKVQVLDQVEAQVWDQVRQRIRGQVSDQTEIQHLEKVWQDTQWIWGQHDAAWLAFYDFFGVCGVSGPNRLSGLMALAAEAGWACCYEHLALVGGRPDLLSRDGRGFLHSETGPALRYRDGWAIYAWHGVRVPERIILRPESITPEEILGQRNAEVRRVLLERFGRERFVRLPGCKQVHKDDWGILYRYEYGGWEEPYCFVRVVNSTPEPDGSFKDYLLRVHPRWRTAREAVASTQPRISNFLPATET